MHFNVIVYNKGKNAYFRHANYKKSIGAIKGLPFCSFKKNFRIDFGANKMSDCISYGPTRVGFLFVFLN